MITKWELTFRGAAWQTHTLYSDSLEVAETTMGHTLEEAKRIDPLYADDYTMTQVPVPRDTCINCGRDNLASHVCRTSSETELRHTIHNIRL